MDTRKQVSRLLGLEIDEVSLVDRPANQHGLVTITKRDEGTMGKLFDAEGAEVDPTTLEVGDVVYDENDNELEYVDAETAAQLAEEGEELFVPEAFLEDDDENADDDERELATVGKSVGSAITGGAHSAFQAGRKNATRMLKDVEGGYKHGRSGHLSEFHGNKELRGAAAHVGRNKNAYVASTAAGTTGAAVGHRRGGKSVKKSLGDTVLTELSKALTEGDRDQVISKAMDEVSKAHELAETAIAKAARLEEQAERGEYVELAKSYELPVESDEFGEILQVIAKSGLNEDQLGLLDQLFYAAGEAFALGEIGAGGIAPSAVEETVRGYATEMVGKSDLTEAEATVALFEQNPDLYTEYLTEQA